MWSWLCWFGCPQEEISLERPEGKPLPAPSPAEVPDEASVSYTIHLPQTAMHRVSVEMHAPCGSDGLTVWMAAWTPGSYLIRDYARLVESVDAGEDPVDKISSNRWKIGCSKGSTAILRYQVVASGWSVREAFVDPDLAVINGAALYLFPEDATGPLAVTVVLPEGWTSAQTSLTPAPDGTSSLRFSARDADELIDSPMLLGNPVTKTFVSEGVPHDAVFIGETEPADLDGLATDLARVVPAVRALWPGPLPYDRYRFLWMLGTDTGGGLEHRASTLLTATPWATRGDRTTLLSLAAHEMLHAWNGKRIRPVGLGPFDYEHPVHTPSLWIVEGVTSYYDDLLLARAGLLSEISVLQNLSSDIRATQTAPGRLKESLAQASENAWTGHYRRDADSPNRSVDYYDKGAVVAWLLDARIRRSTADRASLDDVMHTLWERHAEIPYREEDVWRIVSEIGRAEDAEWLESTVHSAGELDYGGALQWFGLRWREAETLPTLGILTEQQEGRLLVREVREGTPGATAGLSVGDEIIAIAGYRVTSSELSGRLKVLGEGWTGEILVARRGRTQTLTATIGTDDSGRWSLEPDPGASPIARQHRGAWLSP